MWSAAGDEGGDDVGGVTVEVLTASIVDRRGPRVSVAGSELHITQRYSGVEGGHDERSPEHVRMHRTETGPPPDRPNPPVGGASIEALTVAAHEDRTTVSFTDDEVDGAGRSWYQPIVALIAPNDLIARFCTK